MKLNCWLSALCLTASLAHADVVMEQQVESTAMNGVITMKVKGSRARVEAPTPAGQTVSLLDFEKGKMTILLTEQKMAMQMDLAALKKQAEAMQAGGGADAAALKPVATGKKQKIGEWDADEYTVTSQGVSMHLWVAPNFPKGKEVTQELAQVSKALAIRTPDPMTFGLPGMVIRSETDTQIGKVVTTVKSAKQAPVDESEFVVPADFKVMQPPAGFGGK